MKKNVVMNKHIVRLVGVALALIGATAHATTDWSSAEYNLYPGDFDGDGKTDLLYVAKDQAKASGIARSDGTAPNIPFQSWPSNYLGIPWYGNTYVVIVGDFNGDGKSDLFLQRTTPGDSFLLLADANGKITAINQTVSSTYQGLEWSADKHKIIAGDFNGDGKSDLFLQATSSTGTHAFFAADANGQFTAVAAQTWTDATWTAFKWSTQNSILFAGDFNGDGRDDLLVQARPKIVMVDYDIPIPVPTYPPNSNGVALAQSGLTPFQQVGVQQWSRTANGVDWSPLGSNVVIGDFNGDGRDDVVLQSRSSGRSSYLITGNASGAVFSSGTALASNVTWSGDNFRLIAGNFDGTGGAGMYLQAPAASGTNYYANTITGVSVTVTAHDPGAATGVVVASAVGHTVGSFSVSDGGAGTYSIPIAVPQGVAGVQPEVSLNYTSGGGNGLLGVGWGLGGLSEISRCAKTLAQDGVVAAVQLSTSDRFCLDGNKLRLTSGASYGAPNTTYQTEIETFARVTALGTAGNGPASFTVETKEGLTYEYGNTADSRIESLNPSASTTPRVWAVNRVTDRHGNFMTITYQEDGAPNGSFRPAAITYTSNSAASLSSAYKVVFNWGARPATDKIHGIVAGGVVRETNRLTSIETQYNDVGGWRLVRKYQLSYNTSGASGRSRLAAIQECDRDAHCLAPTTFGWQDGTTGWATSPITVATLPASGANGIPVDMNGDGRSDYAYFDSTTNKWRVMFGRSDGGFDSALDMVTLSTNTVVAAMPIDSTGGERRDLLVADPALGKWVRVRYVSGTTFSAISTNMSYTSPGNATYVADVNGDGLDDLVSASTTTLYVAINLGGSAPNFGPFNSAWSTPAQTTLYTSPFGLGGNRYASSIETGDFNGDGAEDLLVETVEDFCGGEPGCPPQFSYDWRVLQWNGSAFTQAATVYSNDTTISRPLLGDFNADGQVDFAYARRNTPTSTLTWRYRLGLVGTEVDTGVQVFGSGAISDCDDDGYSDLVANTSTGSYQCLRSDGSALITTPVPLGTGGGTKVTDVNGDGLSDFIEVDGSNVLKVRPHRGVVADLISTIADGFGNTVSLAYAPLTDSSVYTKGSGATFPDADIQGPIYVVKQYTQSDGIGGTYTITNSYAGARQHVSGRGFLGFASVSSIDGRNGIKTTTSYRQDFPYVGFEATVSTYQSAGGALISQVTNTPAQLPVQGGLYNDRHFPYASQSEQTNYEVGGPSNTLAIARVTVATNLDSYGNETAVTTTTADLTGSGETYSVASGTTYDTPDFVNWCVNFATLQTSTSTVPGLSAQTRTVQHVKDTANPARCRVYQQIVEPNDNAIKVTSTFGYDTFGHPSTQTISAANITSRTTTTSFGSQGVFAVSVTNALGQVAAKTFDYALGVPKSTTDPNNLTVSFDYDNFGRLLQETRPDGTKTTYVYSACSVGNGYCGDARLRYQIEKRELDAGNALIRSSRQLFDAFGRSLYDHAQTLSGAFSIVATNYDNQGRVSQHSQPYFAGFPAYFTTTNYDLLGRPVLEQRRVSEADSSNQSNSFTYNRLTQAQTDASAKTTTKYLNAIGQVTRIVDAANGTTRYEYDQFGNLKKTIDASNNEVVNTFNIRGYKTATTDPDMGSWTYTYYPTGDLWTQTDAKAQTVTFTYDELSRPKTRVENEGTTTWNYGTSAAAHTIGKLVSVTAPGAYSESYTYDSLGRLQDSTTNADATSFVVSNGYNSSTGMLETVTYPTSTSAVSGSRFKVQYEYAYGLSKRVRDFNSPTTIYWEQIATNAAGQTLDEQLGNGLHTYSTYDAISGFLTARTAGASSQVQYLTYQWDKVGNLVQRKDNNPSLSQPLTEDFYYDNLYRLDYSRLNGVTTPNLDLSYDAAGNITAKADGATTNAYNYSAAQSGCTYYTHVQPHAVRKVGTAVYCYDANGNMVRRAGSDITWYSYNLPNRIDQGSNYSQLFYGADRTRYKQVTFTATGGALPSGTETTVYVGGVFEKVTKPTGIVEYKHYILAGKQPIAIKTLRSSGADDVRYLHVDHLGSVDTITNEAGSVVLRLSYDAFGQRRSPMSWSGAIAAGDWTSIASMTHRAFTLHEALDNVGLIHMNGRVYDPSIGRFISADPIIQAPLLSQSLNRYSYVMNNPLSLVDPSGFSWFSKFHRKLRRHLHAVFRYFAFPTLKNLFEVVKSTPGQDKIDRYIMTHKWAYTAGMSIATAATAWGGGFGGALWASYYTYQATGSMTEAIKAGAIVYATNVAMAWIGAQVRQGYNDWASGQGQWWEVSGDPANPSSITKVPVSGPTTSNFAVNGMLNDVNAATVNALQQSAVANQPISLFYNPSHGFIADLTESALMKLTGTSSLGRQLAAALAGAPSVTSIVAHSQGSLIVSNALGVLADSGFQFGSGVTISFYGAAANRLVASNLARAVGVASIGGTDHFFDLVGNVVGFNTFCPVRFIGSIVAAPTLFMGHSISPHSTYP